MEHAYKSTRAKAWRNALVAVINAGLERDLFTLRARRIYGPEEETGAGGHAFAFEAGKIPALGWVSDAGFDELSFHVALWPTLDGERWVRCSNANRLAGEFFAYGWLERRRGLWLQTNSNPLSARRHRLAEVASLVVSPKGYADAGRFIL